MNYKIMQDNLSYLQEWMRYNPSLQDHLRIEGHYLCCQTNDLVEKQDISEFYLPEMLYNENFRQDIKLDTEINGIDLFQIIKLYCQSKEIFEKEQQELQKYPLIKEIKVLKDKNNVEFILLIDELNQKYRYDTNKPEEVINIFNNLREKKQKVTLKELGSVLHNVN